MKANSTSTSCPKWTIRGIKRAPVHRGSLKQLPNARNIVLRPAWAFAILLPGMILAACGLSPSSGGIDLAPWKYADLRSLDEAVDAEIKPSLDLLALYTRMTPGGFEVRLDFLDLPVQADYDLLVGIGCRGVGGGEESSVLRGCRLVISIPAESEIMVEGGGKGFLASGMVSIQRDPTLDMVTIHLRREAVAGLATPLAVRAYTYPAGSLENEGMKMMAADELSTPSPDAPPPPQAQVLLAFHHVFPAYTPAQSLRRWDGAHTGPQGGRHGLSNLLRAARIYQAPLALLDLKAPTSLAALDLIAGMGLVRQMAVKGLILLPDVAPASPGSPLPELPGWGLERAARESHQSGLDFGLPGGQSLYAPWTEGLLSQATLLNRYRLVFTPTKESSGSITRLLRRGNLIVLPIAMGMDALQASTDGLSMETRKELFASALQADPAGRLENSPIVMLGGELPGSTWGIPEAAMAAMRYLKAHPWIHLLSADDLLAARASTPAPQGVRQEATPPEITQLFDELGSALSSLPFEPACGSYSQPGEGGIRSAKEGCKPPRPAFLAWQALVSLYAPLSPSSPELGTLRNLYLGQAAALLRTERWAEQPANISACDEDVDLDGRAECILASDEFFSLYEIESGALIFAFARRPDGVHQIIGPSSQLITGLSDPATWRLKAGENADPAVLSGSFGDAGPFQAQPSPGQITFQSSEMSKAYQLSPAGLHLAIQSQERQSTRLVLALDPWLRFTPGWAKRYQGRTDGDTWVWSANSSLAIKVTSEPGGWTAQTFKDSLPLLHGIENPNQEMPAGHFLPFPLAVIEFPPTAQREIHITWSP